MPEKILRVKFIADETFASMLKAVAAQQPFDLKIESETIEIDASKLGFDLGTIISLVAVAKGGWDALTLANKIYTWWNNRKKEKSQNRLVIQTPFKKLELESETEITEEQIREFLEAVSINKK